MWSCWLKAITCTPRSLDGTGHRCWGVHDRRGCVTRWRGDERTFCPDRHGCSQGHRGIQDGEQLACQGQEPVYAFLRPMTLSAALREKMPHETFPNPPIVEAVIEIRFEEPYDDATRKKVGAKLSAFYPHEKEQQGRGINIDLDNSAVRVEELPSIIHRSNDEHNESLLLTPSGFAVSQLAVYPGWQPFFDRFQRDWAVWKSIVGYRKVAQIGMRFVNRIDVPLVDNVARHEDYLTLQIQLPPEYPTTIGYSLFAQIPLPEIKGIANVNSSAAQSPVPAHAAFMLDIDVIRLVDVPQKDSDIVDLLNQMRDAKNGLFQSFITDAARERFRSDQPLR
jgi:uncharacterized protein (TIGR04255 family)